MLLKHSGDCTSPDAKRAVKVRPGCTKERLGFKVSSKAQFQKGVGLRAFLV